jgi:hypothetical protein
MGAVVGRGSYFSIVKQEDVAHRTRLWDSDG